MIKRIPKRDDERGVGPCCSRDTDRILWLWQSPDARYVVYPFTQLERQKLLEGRIQAYEGCRQNAIIPGNTVKYCTE